MFKWLKRQIAWAVARRDLEELERWRVECDQVRRWMAEFPDVCTALDHIERFATGLPYRGLTEVREGMRRRPARPGPFTLTLRQLTLGEVDEFKRIWTDWDVAARQATEFIDEDFERTHAAIMADPPTHFTGLIAPAPRRVAYKFLSPGCAARS